MLGGNSLNEGSVAIGANALAYNANTAYRGYNVAIGSNAMNTDGGASNARKSYSIAIGPNALRGAKIASYTIAIGNYAGVGPKFYDTVLIGNYAGCAIDDNSGYIPGVYSSVYIGDRAGYAPTGPGTGNKNVAIGSFSLFNRTQANNTVAIGTYSSGSTTVNKAVGNTVVIGTYAGFNPKSNNSSGGGTSIGYYAGAEAEAGVMIGTYAGYNSVNSTAIGTYAGYNAKYTTAIGTYAGYNASYDTEGHVFIGYYAGANVDNGGTSGSTYLPAVAIGNNAGRDVEGNASYSIYIGNDAGYNTSVRESVCIGYNACQGLGQSPTTRGFIRIASKDGEWDDEDPSYNVSVIGDVPSEIKDAINVSAPFNINGDTLVLTPLYSNKNANYDSSIVLYGFVYGYTNSLTSFSDRRLKRDIVPTKYGLKDIRKINVYNYNWKSDDTKTQKIGVIAQELQKVIPEGVLADKNDAGGYLTVNVEWLIYPMINAIKELDVQVQTIKKQVVAYSKEYVTLVERVSKLEKEVKVLEKENKALTRDVKVAYKKVKKAESLR